MQAGEGRFQVRLAQDERDLLAAQQLRYDVFVREMGASGPSVDHDNALEQDHFDAYCEHLLLTDQTVENGAPGHVVGVYRMMMRAQAERAGGFYSESEFDLSPLMATGRPVLELGRSCVHASVRGGATMLALWNGLARYVLDHGVEIMFGTASFPGTDLDALAEALSYLHAHHLAPEEMRVRAIGDGAARMDRVAVDGLARAEMLSRVPPLIKAYLRLGGFVGDGAFVDRAFNTTDICLLMDTESMNAKSRSAYTKKAGY